MFMLIHKDVLLFSVMLVLLTLFCLNLIMPDKNIFCFDYTLILCDKYDPLKMPFNRLTYLL